MIQQFSLKSHLRQIDSLELILNQAGYAQKSEPWRFTDSGIIRHRFTRFKGEEFMVVDAMIGDDERHRAILDNAVLASSNDGAVRIASKDDLIWMKSLRNPDLDQIDIKKLSNDTP